MAGAVLVVVTILGLVYILSAGVAGKWMADNVIAPIFEVFSGGTPTATPQSTQNQGQQKVVWNEFTLYCLQMGIFSSEDNAKALADSLKTKGAAGYLMHDGVRVRVLLSAYTKEADAKAVRDRLIGENMDCTVYTLKCNKLELTITADQTRLPRIQPIFDRYGTAVLKCGELAFALDGSKTTQDEALADVKDLAQKMKDDAKSIEDSGYANSNTVVSSMLSLLTEGNKALGVAAEGTANTLSARLKYAQLQLAGLGVDFVKNAQNGLSDSQ
ncbi:MAG: SPOR domain-containing protein [Bacillota bacterium]